MPLQNLDDTKTVLAFLHDLEKRTETLETSSLATAKANQPDLPKPHTLCQSPDCPQCAMTQRHIQAALKQGEKNGRNKMLELLDKAAQNLGMVEQANQLAVQCQQLEAGLGDPAAQQWIIEGLVKA